jgi:hypothetical protein
MYEYEDDRLIPDLPWHHKSVGGILTELSEDMQMRISADDQAIDSLWNDIVAASATANPSTQEGSQVFVLQTNYFNFLARWKEWLSHGDDTLNDAWIITAKENVERSEADYRTYRTRFTSLGGRPSLDVPEPSEGPFAPLGKFADTLVSLAPWIALGAVAWIFLPALLPALAARKG